METTLAYPRDRGKNTTQNGTQLGKAEEQMHENQDDPQRCREAGCGERFMLATLRQRQESDMI